MVDGIIGYKRGMTRIFNEEGVAVPVTVIEAGPCTVTQVRTEARDGYSAVQLGFGETKSQRLTGGQRGHLQASKAGNLRHLREFSFSGEGSPELGQKIDCSIFEAGQRVDVTGTSKGRGFAGAIKRHNFSRQRKTHGQTDRERAPGAVGAGSTPGRTFKGKRMAGQMGGERVTVRNIEVVVADPSRNLLAIRGAVPGFNGALVMIRARKN